MQRRLLPGGDLVDFRGDAVTLRDSLEVALIEGVGELLGWGPEFIHAHGCVSSHIVRHAPGHTVTERYRQICPLPGALAGARNRTTGLIRYANRIAKAKRMKRCRAT